MRLRKKLKTVRTFSTVNFDLTFSLKPMEKTLYQSCIEKKLTIKGYESDLSIKVTKRSLPVIKTYIEANYIGVIYRDLIDKSQWVSFKHCYDPFWKA